MTVATAAETSTRRSLLGGRNAVRIDGLAKRFVVRRTLAEILSRPFDRRYAHALRDVTFAVREGEFFGVLGPNGAGKSTLFKTLATIVIPDKGRGTVLGHDVVKEAQEVRRLLIPVVADERSLRWRLSARENLRLYAVLYGVPRSLVVERVEEALAIVQLQDTGPQMVGQFSSGMKQRLLIARALMARPRVLLLDEPTRGLDPVSARSLRAFLRDEVCRRQGCTVVLATHNADEAFGLCDRVGILDQGRMLVTGAASDLAAEYGEARYRLSVLDPDHQAIAALRRTGLVDEVGPPSLRADGWVDIDLVIQGGPPDVARVLELLVSRGVSVSSMERVGLSLAELIERVQQSREENPDA
jgi:ABC-2 type transport system ATP-binding protein